METKMDTLKDSKNCLPQRPLPLTPKKSRITWRKGLYILIGASAFVLWSGVRHGSFVERLESWAPSWRHEKIGTQASCQSEHSFFSWNEVIPKKHLQYTPCFDGYQCARLDVPLNWNASNLDIGPRAAIAIIKLPAKVPVTDERYGGAILMNPGGPGESGIYQVKSAGKHVQNILDSPKDPSSISTEISDAKYYDIIGFDSRGVNNTTPRLRCFPDAFNQQAWALSSPDMSLLLDSESLLGLHWARAKALGESCSREDNEDDMARFVNTAQVVEDMVEVIERHAEWRQEEARSILQLPKEKTSSRYPEYAESIMERLQWKKGTEKLQYWGFSYGTIIGATFSAMHPNRVGRVVIDGVVDPSDYYGAHWLKNLRDTDKIMVKFSEYCFQAGPEKCPLYLGTSATDIEAHIEKVVTDLKENPIPVPASDTRGPEVISYGDVISVITSSLYETYAEAEGLFHLLSELSRGNAVPFAEMKQIGLVAAEVPRACKHDGPFSDACVSADYVAALGATRGIACMDARDITNMTKDEFREHAEKVQSQSKWMGTNWAALPLGCVGYTIRPAWSFEGAIEGNTSHPLLIIGNTHDPVTPLRNARYVSTLFPNSVVLQQDSEGHCTYSNPSICTGKVLREYFHSGKLPDKSTVCTPEYKPFIGCMIKDENGNCRKLETDDQKMWDAMEAITSVWP